VETVGLRPWLLLFCAVVNRFCRFIMYKCDMLSLQFYNLEVNDFEAKIVLKPLDYERKWKFQYKPISGDIQLLSKKIPVTKFLNLQVIFLLEHPVSCNSVSFVLGKPQVQDNLIFSMKHASNGAPINVN
jgi:hypothetical protein